MKIAAISRAREHSPGMADKDRAILEAVAACLRLQGASVQVFGDDEDFSSDSFCLIYHMSRSDATLERLASVGCCVINTPQAVRNCSRASCMQIMASCNIPQPYFALSTSDAPAPDTSYPMWLKKSNGWACHPDDVCYAADKAEAEKAIAGFRSRNIHNILCSRHIVGDIIKFYGISGRFFRWHYPSLHNTKFGLERINGEIHRYPFDVRRLEETAFAAAAAIGVDIFGGDCIVMPDGEISIIDFNDFPSFSAYRAEAAEAIADLIISKIRKE